MRQNYLKIILGATLLTLWFSSATWAQRKKSPGKSRLPVKNCKAGKLAFPCPSEYTILLGGEKTNSVFFAKSTEFPYGVFVLGSTDKSDQKNLESKVTENVLRSFYSGDKRKFIWKDVESDSRPSSKFETGKRRTLGFNGDRIVTLDFRHIKFKGKLFLIGTIVEGLWKGDSAARDFEIGAYTANSGCFDALEIIRYVTGEKDGSEMDPCSHTIT